MPEKTMPPELIAAEELARRATMRFPNESAEYRAARTALLAEEIKLRRQIEAVAEQRRALPPGGEVLERYRFIGEDGQPATLADLFAGRDTLIAYSWMFGPQRARPCPMCTSMLSALDGEAKDISQRAALAVIARSPIEKLIAFKRERGWHGLRLFSDADDAFSRDYFGVTPDEQDVPALNVFSRRDGTIRLFWAGEMDGDTADPGQDPRGAPDLMPLWTFLDMTPEGRGSDWYPSLTYPH
jgi:predicted dithiol-disulfide oxidoreductase (DUF899 family)